MMRRLVSCMTWGFAACAVVTAALTLSMAAASAAVPTLMNYQGFLSTGSSQPAQGAHAMTFSLYADSTEGVARWSESYAAVQVTAGVFNVLLGSVTPLPPSVFDGTSLWLQTDMDGVGLQPRQHIVTVAYSFHAAIADSALSTKPDFEVDAGSIASVPAASFLSVFFRFQFSGVPYVVASFHDVPTQQDENLGAACPQSVSMTGFTIHNTDNQAHKIQWAAIYIR